MKRILISTLVALSFTTTSPQIVEDLRKINFSQIKTFVVAHKKACLAIGTVAAVIYIYNKYSPPVLPAADAESQTSTTTIVSPQFRQAANVGTPFSPSPQSPTDVALEDFQKMMHLAQENAETRDYIDELKQNLAAQQSVPSPTAADRRKYYAKEK